MANEMRDRLVELYAKAKRNMWGRTFHSDLERNMYIADYLIANDVVPVVWISVHDRLPDEDVRVLVSINSDRSYTKVDTDRIIDGKWVRWDKDITHWLPLPELPKEC